MKYTVQKIGCILMVVLEHNWAYKYLVYPGAVDTDSLLTHVTQLPLPHEWRCRVNTGEGSGTWAFSLGVQYID